MKDKLKCTIIYTHIWWYILIINIIKGRKFFYGLINNTWGVVYIIICGAKIHRRKQKIMTILLNLFLQSCINIEMVEVFFIIVINVYRSSFWRQNSYKGDELRTNFEISIWFSTISCREHKLKIFKKLKWSNVPKPI